MSMSDQESIFYKRNLQGEIIINVNSHAIKIFFRWLVMVGLVKPLVGLINVLYASIDTVSHHKPLLFILAGIGIGFGMGIVVFQRPVVSLASPFPVYAQPTSVTADQLQIGGVSFRTQVPIGENNLASISHLETSAGLHQNGTAVLVIGWRSEARTYLQNATIADLIQVIGSNNGRYTYRIVEIKEVDNELLPTLFNQNGRALVLYTPANLLQTKHLVIIAK